MVVEGFPVLSTAYSCPPQPGPDLEQATESRRKQSALISILNSAHLSPGGT